jgi:hypothetical protein
MRRIGDIYHYAEIIFKIPGLKSNLMKALFPIHQSAQPSTVSILIKAIGGSIVGHSKLAITLKILTVAQQGLS